MGLKHLGISHTMLGESNGTGGKTLSLVLDRSRIIAGPNGVVHDGGRCPQIPKALPEEVLAPRLGGFILLAKIVISKLHYTWYTARDLGAGGIMARVALIRQINRTTRRRLTSGRRHLPPMRLNQTSSQTPPKVRKVSSLKRIYITCNDAMAVLIS